ncbi:hypothetical protein [Streptomyces lunaelactis]|uniref:hypothetical protein n=1 Tax=Streptomyces lunaelactis TaxID=1535768 RepID=UPI00131EE12A|nr:hypothetical protein [Streptomyces lunaelactis]NUK88478.1 hypothetical protein [Streptomyces lunaelactis]
MRVQIAEILDTQSKIVAFDGPAGSGWAYWHGSTEPQAGAYDVELEVPDVVSSWTLTTGPDLITGEYSRREVTLRGSVQSVGEDDVVALRIDRDIVLVEVGADITEASIGDSVEFTTSSLLLYPYAM